MVVTSAHTLPMSVQKDRVHHAGAFLFTATVRENIIYGNPEYKGHSSEALRKILESKTFRIYLLG